MVDSPIRVAWATLGTGQVLTEKYTNPLIYVPTMQKNIILTKVTLQGGYKALHYEEIK